MTEMQKVMTLRDLVIKASEVFQRELVLSARVGNVTFQLWLLDFVGALPIQ